MLPTVQHFILLCLIGVYGDFNSLFGNPLSPALEQGKNTCYKEVAGIDTFTEKEKTAMWENEDTGYHLLTCVLKQIGAIKGHGIDIGLVKNAILQWRIRRLLPEVPSMDESIDRCYHMTIYKNDVDQITRCIFDTVKQAYKQMKK